MNRIPFGQECRLNLGNGPVCPSCGVKRGTHHKPGCDAEECPSCGKQLLICECDVLPLGEQAVIMQAVAAKFPTCLAALEFACESPGNQSLSVRAAWLAGWRLATPEIKAKQKEGMDRFFPEHRPDFYDSTGKGFMSLGALAKSLGKPVEDVEAMVKVLGDHGKSPVGELYRVN